MSELERNRMIAIRPGDRRRGLLVYITNMRIIPKSIDKTICLQYNRERFSNCCEEASYEFEVKVQDETA